nr:MAG TPA: hypothetical protein [Herelleviridae sp.]
MAKLNLDTFIEITAITQAYELEIENHLLETEGEILQDDLAEIVMDLFFAYQKLDDEKSMLDLINSKEITLKEVL